MFYLIISFITKRGTWRFSNTEHCLLITRQLSRRFSHVPNLIREVTVLWCNLWINWILQFQIKYDFVESATETVENSA